MVIPTRFHLRVLAAVSANLMAASAVLTVTIQDGRKIAINIVLAVIFWYIAAIAEQRSQEI